MEPLESMNAAMRAAVAKTYSDRGDDVPQEAMTLDYALKLLERVDSFAGVNLVVSYLVSLANENRAMQAHIEKLELTIDDLRRPMQGTTE